MAGELFTILCSNAPFSMDELVILRRYGREFERLSNGERAPATAAQEQFVEAARGKNPPETIYERVWTKYLKRFEWESDPANRSAMGRGGGFRTTARTGSACAERSGAMPDDGRKAWTNRYSRCRPLGRSHRSRLAYAPSFVRRG